MTPPPFIKRDPKTASHLHSASSNSEPHRGSRPDSSAIITTAASPFIYVSPAVMARPKPCGGPLGTSAVRDALAEFGDDSAVRSLLPSSTTMISCGTLSSRSSTCKCSTVEAMHPSSSLAGIHDRQQLGDRRAEADGPGLFMRHTVRASRDLRQHARQSHQGSESMVMAGPPIEACLALVESRISHGTS